MQALNLHNNETMDLLRPITQEDQQFCSRFRGLAAFLFSTLAALFIPEISLGARADGYVSDVKLERQEKFREVFLFVKKPTAEKKLWDSIFNPQLSKEFRDKYREKFGQLDSESIVYQRSQTTSFDPVRDNFNSTDVRVAEQQRERRAFAEYMTKRLAEWHVDNYFKNEPSMRPVYELKETLSHMDVKVTKETKLEIQYNLTQNNIDFILSNPYLDETKMSVEMDPHSLGPSGTQENRLKLAKQLTPRTRLNNNWATIDGLTTFELLTRQTPVLTTSMAVTAKYSSNGRAEGATRYLVGMSYSF